MSQTIYVCPRWETEGIEELKKPIFLTDDEGNKSVSGLLKTSHRSKRRVFTEGNFFFTLAEAQQHANVLKLAEEGEAKDRLQKLVRQGYFKGDMLKLPA